MSTEERARIVRKAIAVIDQIREEVRAEAEANAERVLAAERRRLDAERAELDAMREALNVARAETYVAGAKAGQVRERADTLAFLRAHKGSWERAAQAIEAGKHLGKGAD